MLQVFSQPNVHSLTCPSPARAASFASLSGQTGGFRVAGQRFSAHSPEMKMAFHYLWRMDRKRKKRIDELEERNSELAKEILLNESAVYHVEKEIKAIDADISDHEHIQANRANRKIDCKSHSEKQTL